MIAPESRYIIDHFAPAIHQIERVLAEAPDGPNLYHRALKHLDPDIFFYLIKKTADLPDAIDRLIPDWPSEEIRKQSTGDNPLVVSLLEATTFWDAVRRITFQITGVEVSSLRVADYGAGWGRIARISGKDVPSDRFYGFEPNPQFCDLYRACRVPGTLIPTDWGSYKSLDQHGAFDVLYSFSILTHSSDLLTKRIRDRWIEMTKPGSLVFATIRPRFFLYGGRGDAAKFADKASDELDNLYKSGQLLYEPYDGGGDWGVTVMGPKYIDAVFGAHFAVRQFVPVPTTANQMIVVLERY